MLAAAFRSAVLASVLAAGACLAAGPAHAAPDDRIVAFKIGGTQFWSMKPDGSQRRRLLRPVEGADVLARSADGRRIAVVEWHPNDDLSTIYSIGVDGSGRLVVPNVPGQLSDPALSPDGSELAAYVTTYVTTPNPVTPLGPSTITADSRIVVVDLATGAVRTVAEFPGSYLAGVTWTPDGRLAYLRNAGEHRATLEILAPEGGLPHAVSPGVPRAGGSFDWAPDGRRVALLHGTGGQGTGSRLVVIDDGGTDRRTLTRRRVGYVDWSPDGRRILYVADASPRTPGLDAARIIPAAGGRAIRLPKDDSPPLWSPSGKRLVAKTEKGLIIRRPNGRRVRLIPRTKGWVPISWEGGRST